ncbi:MAG: DUF4956 domain-containing protein [Candidatus Ornithomonoglobus sp.]
MGQIGADILDLLNASSTMTTGEELVTLLAALIFGVVISITYMKTQKQEGYSQSLALTLTMLPVILAMIIMFVGSNVARAFSLAGTLSIIRFRSAPGEPKDIGYIFFDIAAGLACGVGQFMYGALFVIIVCLFMTALSVFRFGTPKADMKTLKITIPEDLDYQNAFNDILDKYAAHYTLKKVRTTDLGSLFELEYKINMKKDSNDKKLIDELRCRNGNLSIILSLAEASL